MDNISVFTIGFTKTGAENFFGRLLRAGVKKVIDVRLHNTSQLSGFAKSDDLSFFLRNIGGIEYLHEPLLAPTDDILRNYKTERGDWRAYEKLFLKLMADRQIENRLKPDIFSGSCLLCSEAKPHNCHRRLVCEYLNHKWSDKLKVVHL